MGVRRGAVVATLVLDLAYLDHLDGEASKAWDRRKGDWSVVGCVGSAGRQVRLTLFGDSEVLFYYV